MPEVPNDFENEEQFIISIRQILKDIYIDKDKCVRITEVKSGEYIPDDIMNMLNTFILNEVNFRYNFITKQEWKPSRKTITTIQDNFLDDLRIKYK